MNNPNVNQIGRIFVDTGKQVIVPNTRFNCNGRITNVAVSMFGWFGTNLPLFQVWHPTSLNSNTYNKISEVQLPAGDLISSSEGGNYYHVSLSLNNNSQIEFQSGDVIGYYQPSNPRQSIWSIFTSGYISYSNTTTTPLTSIDTNNVDQLWANHQPLIEVMFGKIYIAISHYVILCDLYKVNYLTIYGYNLTIIVSVYVMNIT